MDFIQSFSNISTVSSYLKDFGVLAPAVAFGLFVVQAALPVFPYVILAAVGGLLFGFKIGALLAWSGALAGACLAYWVVRLSSADWVINKIEHKYHYDLKTVNGEMAFWTIVIARIIPVVPTPLINVVAAVSGVSFSNFLFSSAIGKIPTAVLYTGLGVCLFNTQDIKMALIIIGAIIALVVVGRYLTKGKVNIIN